MNFDITRAWKDETYRQTLTQEELSSLPANPAGELELIDVDLELTEVDLESVNGGFDGGFGFSCGSCGSCGPNVFIADRTNSVALICEININSINLVNLAILGFQNNTCINSN